LKLKCDILLSNFAFKFNLRHYVKGEKDAFRQVARIKAGIGIEGGMDKYTGETLDAIAKRASLAAVAAGPGALSPEP